VVRSQAMQRAPGQPPLRSKVALSAIEERRKK
jgi:hypothetical protein